MPSRALGLLTTALFAIACSQSGALSADRTSTSAAPSATGVVVRALDDKFVMPARWPGGWVSVTLLDDGGEPHQLQLARLRSNVSLDTIRSAFASNPAAAFVQLVLAGGPDFVVPGRGQQVTVWLEAGDYVGFDLAVGPDGIQNVNEGMLQQFSAGANAPAAEPTASLEIVELSTPMHFEVPDIPAGPVVVRVTDESPEDDHEAAILQLAAGITFKEVISYLRSPQGPPPFLFAGGMAALEPRQTGYLSLDLQPGAYALVCFVSDPESGRFHWEQGMIQPFGVKAT
jgi:hypothetical protein